MLSTNGDLWWAGGDLTRLASPEKAKGRRISILCQCVILSEYGAALRNKSNDLSVGDRARLSLGRSNHAGTKGLPAGNRGICKTQEDTPPRYPQGRNGGVFDRQEGSGEQLLLVQVQIAADGNGALSILA
jgi:hypothetical protein